jgi:hypothetical protein
LQDARPAPARVAQGQPEQHRETGVEGLAGQERVFEPHVRIPDRIHGVTRFHVAALPVPDFVERAPHEKREVEKARQAAREPVLPVQAGGVEAGGGNVDHLARRVEEGGGADGILPELEEAFALGLRPPAARVGDQRQQCQHGDRYDFS